MKLITIRSQIMEVVNSWEQTCWQWHDPEKMRVLRELQSLKLETATAEDVAKIIGNASWVCKKRCHECGERHDTVIEVGEEPDYESATACLCAGCVREALRIVERGG